MPSTKLVFQIKHSFNRAMCSNCTSWIIVKILFHGKHMRDKHIFENTAKDV